MKRLTTVVAVLVILGLVLPSFVLAQDRAVTTPTEARGGARMGVGQGQGRPGRPGGPQAQRPRQVGIHQLFRVALLAARAREDAELQTMVDKVIKGRMDLLKLEEKQLGIFEEVVVAIRAENKELAKAKGEELKAAREEMKAKSNQLGKDIHAIAQRLHEIMPELGEKAGRGLGLGGEAGTGRPQGRAQGRGQGQGRPGRGRPAPEDVDELPVDIY